MRQTGHNPDESGFLTLLPRRFIYSRHFLLICLAVAFAIRLIWIASVKAEQLSDFQDYVSIGQSIAKGEGYYYAGKPSAFRPIGYPAFLGLLFYLFGPGLLAAKLANVVFSVGILALAYFISKRAHGSELVARLTVIVLAFYPNHIAYTSLLATEIPFLFLLLLGIALLYLENKTLPLAVAAGVVFGLGALVKPQTLLVPAIILGPSLVFAFDKKKLIRLVVVCAAMLLPILPWSIRNYRAFGRFVLISYNSGFPLLVGNNPYANGGYMKHDFHTSVVREAKDRFERERIAKKYATKYMRQHPFRTVALWPAKAWHLWRGDADGIYWNERGVAGDARAMKHVFRMRQLGPHAYFVIGIAGLFGIILTLQHFIRRKDFSNWMPVHGILLLGYYTFIAMVFFGDTRYHFHLIPWLVIYAAVFFDEARLPGADWVRSIWRRRFAPRMKPAFLNARVAFAIAMAAIFLIGTVPRFRATAQDEPDLTNSTEFPALYRAEESLKDGAGQKPKGVEHAANARYLRVLFKPAYAYGKVAYQWDSVDDVQWWRMRHYWRWINVALTGLIAILAGVIGVRAFNWRIGLVAALICATAPRFVIWFCTATEEAPAAFAGALAIYFAYRLVSDCISYRRWILFGGIATGSAIALVPAAAPIAFCFLVTIPIAPGFQRRLALDPMARVRRYYGAAVAAYLGICLLAVFLWTPEIFSHSGAANKAPSVFSQFLKFLSPRGFFAAWGQTWRGLFYERTIADGYPFWFAAIIYAMLLIGPIYAVVHRRKVMLVLMIAAWGTFFWLLYLKRTQGYYLEQHTAPTVMAVFFLLAIGLDKVCEAITAIHRQLTVSQRQTFQFVVLLFVCLPPLFAGRTQSLETLNEIRGNDNARAQRRAIVHSLPLGSRIFLTTYWPKPHLFDSLFEYEYVVPLYTAIDKTHTLADVRRDAWDYACLQDYNPKVPSSNPPYLKELKAGKKLPTYILPSASRWLRSFSFVSVQPDDGVSFTGGFFFRRPSIGDYCGLSGILPGSADSTPRSVTLHARFLNRKKWWANYADFEVLLDGNVIWRAEPMDDPKHIPLNINLNASPGAEIQLRLLRADFNRRVSWKWARARWNLVLDGIRITDTATGEDVPISWRPIGRNGGPEPQYGMRSDWLNNGEPVTLLDPGFDGVEPLVNAWRPSRSIDPLDAKAYPDFWKARESSRIVVAPRLGIDGSVAIRFIAKNPAKESLRLGIMQPMTQPAARSTRSIRIHYRPASRTGNQGEVALRLTALARSLSGEYIDRAVTEAALDRTADRWEPLELDLRKIWKRRRTRVDLIEFLEVSFEVIAGPDAICDILVDKVERQ